MKKKAQSALGFLKSILASDSDTDLEAAFKIISAKISQFEDAPVAMVSTGELPVPSDFIGKDALMVFSDGGCRGNPGLGSWATIAQNTHGDLLFELSGTDMVTTNNKMELYGVINGLNAIWEYMAEEGFPPDTKVVVYCDSKYVIDGMNKWLQGWKKRGWKKSDKKPPENLDIWQSLDTIMNCFSNLENRWVEGHSGHPQNEYCDKLANIAMDSIS